MTGRAGRTHLGDTQTASESSKKLQKHLLENPARARTGSWREADSAGRGQVRSDAAHPCLSLSRPLRRRHRHRHSSTPRRGAAARAPHPDRSAFAARSSPRAGLRSRPTRHAVGRRTHRGVRSRGRLRQTSRRPLSRAPSRISSPRPGARRKPPPRRRPSGKRAVRARRSLTPQSEKPSRLRKLIVAGAAVLIAGVFLHVALRMFQDRATPSNSPDTPPAAPSQGAAPPAVLPESDSSKTGPQSGPLILPVPGAQSPAAPVQHPARRPPRLVHRPVRGRLRRRTRRMHRPPYCNTNRRCRTPRTSPAHCRVASRRPYPGTAARRASRWNRLPQRQRRRW